MANWLITGAQGFLARYAVAEILSLDPDAQVFGIGRSAELSHCFSHRVTAVGGEVEAPFPVGLSTPEPSHYRYQSVDLRQTADVKRILDMTRPNFILHFASALRGDPLAHQLSSNIEATASLFHAIADIPHFHPAVLCGSTGGVYGMLHEDDLPVNEDHCPRPADEYAVTKLAAEQLAINAAARSGVRLIIGRIFNLVGAAQDERHVAARIALQMTNAEHGGEATITLGSLSATRDFIDVRDAARACVELLRNPEARGVVNIASGYECSIQELVDAFLKYPKRSISVKSAGGAALDVPRHVGDIRRLSGFGFQPRFTLEASAASIWAYYQRLWGS